MNRKLKKIKEQKDLIKKEKSIFFMQSVALASYARFCIKLKIVPELKMIETLENCEDEKKLMHSHKTFLAHL